MVIAVQTVCESVTKGDKSSKSSVEVYNAEGLGMEEEREEIPTSTRVKNLHLGLIFLASSQPNFNRVLKP